MKLGFEDAGQVAYDSGSQSARVMTEAWALANAFCPNCGRAKLDKFINNKPVADFYCSDCLEEFELKSTKANFGKKIVNGAFETMCDRLESENNPNLLLMKYSLKNAGVESLFIIPKKFFILDIIERRKPLAETARRAGWIGCNILIGQVPDIGKIHIVRNSAVVDRQEVLRQWQQTLFLRNTETASRGWLLNVIKCVEDIGNVEFTLDDVYAFEPYLKKIYPGNNYIKEKIRQQLQVLRDKGLLEFLGRGRYRRLVL